MKNRFRIGTTILVFTLLSAIMLSVAGCKAGYDHSKNTGIDSLRVISATGNKDNWNNMSIDNKMANGKYSDLMKKSDFFDVW